MSGRVKWRPFTSEPDRARMLVVGRMRVGDVVPVGDGWDATVYGTDERETFTRRRAATRWLIARAAGLAEVPRARRPRGWRDVVLPSSTSLPGVRVTVRAGRDRRRR